MVLARWQATIVDEAGNIQDGASVTVRREAAGAPLASIFSDRDGASALGNPITADSEGFAAFHAAGGAYRITATKGAFSRVWRYVAIGTLAEQDSDAPVFGNAAVTGHLDLAEISEPASPAANTARVFARDVSGRTELAYERSNGQVVALSPAAVSLMDFAAGDGVTDDTTAIKDWLETGGELYAPEGEYLVAAAGADAGGVVATITESTYVICHPNARFVADTNLDNDIVRLQCDTAGYTADRVIDVQWIGGQFDLTAQRNSTSVPFSTEYPPPNLGSSATTDGLSIRGQITVMSADVAGFNKITTRHVRCVASPTGHWESAGGDSGIFLDGAKWIDAQYNELVGCRDAGIYISGLNSGTIEGGGGNLSNNVARGCVVGVTAKRAFNHVTIKNNRGYNTAIVASHEVVSSGGTGVIMEGNIGENAWIVARCDEVTAGRICGNISTNHGHLLEDDSLPSDVFNLNNACLRMRGILNSQISGNTVHGRDSAYSAVTVYTVILEESADAGNNSDENQVYNNSGDDIEGIVIEVSGEADSNILHDNRGTSLGGIPVTVTGAASIDLDQQHWRVIGKSAVASSHTGDTNETTLATVTVPANAMGPNGAVRITTLWSFADDADPSGSNKTARIRFGGTGGTIILSNVLTTNTALADLRLVSNRNSASSQVAAPNSLGGGLGQNSGSLATGSIDTTSDVDIVFRGTLADADDTITLERYLVEVLYGA